MKLTKNNIFLGILISVLIVNALVLININQFYLRTVITYIFLITIPGLLLMLIFKIKETNPWEYLIYVIGLSISFIFFISLLINWILPLIGISKPLSTIPLLISFDIFLLVFCFVAYIRNKVVYFKILPLKLSKLNIIFIVILMFFPVLSVLGAITLNNSGPNITTMIVLAGIAIYVLIVILHRDKLNKNIYPLSILIISISLLLAVSLRSQYISGWDIFQEYYVFQLTKESFTWSMSNYQDAYNACLSITILPTVFSSFLKINDHYIFKLLFQILGGFIPVGIFLFLKKFARDTSAFIASFFFISQSTFFAHLTKAVRQEIAFLFFALVLLALFNKSISTSQKKILFSIFGASLIVSHYSTAYVAIVTFILAYLICLFFRKTENRKPFFKIYEKLNLKEKDKLIKTKYYLSWILILFLIAFAFIWYAPLTNISGGLVNLATKTFKNMGSIFSKEIREEGLSFDSQWNIFYEQEDKTPVFRDYVKDITSDYEGRTYVSQYSSEKYEDYISELVDDEIISPKINSGIVSNIYAFIEIIKKMMKVLIIIGTLYILFFKLKKREMDIEYIFLCLISLFSLAAMMILPIVTIEYSLDRLYQQVLVFLALPAVLGSFIIFKFIKENYRIVLIAIIVLLYYLFFSGLIPQAIGGTDATFQLNNYGDAYNSHYTHRTEIASSYWMKENHDNKSMIYADRLALWRLLAFGRFTLIFDDILPSTIDKNAYVYLRYSNVTKNICFKRYKGQGLTYDFPIEFLNENKNLIYNNGGSKVFK